jgi:hypothetical protein
MWKCANAGHAVAVSGKCNNFLLSIFRVLFLVNIRCVVYSTVSMIAEKLRPGGIWLGP